MTRKKLALAATSVATMAMMAGPAALTVAAQDTPQDIRTESGWMKHGKSFKGQGHYFGHDKQKDGEHVRGENHERGKRMGRKGDRRNQNLLKGVDLTEDESAEIREALRIKQDSILEAMRTKMNARIEAMETTHDAVLQAFEIEDADEREEALEAIHDEAKEERKEIRTTFREVVKTAYETFTSTVKSLLGLEA